MTDPTDPPSPSLNDKLKYAFDERVQAELIDQLDEELELEFEDLFEAQLSEELGRGRVKNSEEIREFRKKYFRELRRLQIELVRLQEWVVETGYKLVVLFEGRDSAGKGGVIKRISQRTNPRVCRVVALPAPTEREQNQWYFQRYVQHLPSAGEIVLFDRSWYNRAGVERVMGFCSEQDVAAFYRDVPLFEEMLVNSGIKLVKYWFSIEDEEQEFRFTCRIKDPLKQWKLSPMDLQSRIRWEDYTKAKEDTFRRSSFSFAPWWIVPANDKKRARLNCIAHLLKQVPYQQVDKEEVVLPERVHHEGYRRNVVPEEMIVPMEF